MRHLTLTRTINFHPDAEGGGEAAAAGGETAAAGTEAVAAEGAQEAATGGETTAGTVAQDDVKTLLDSAGETASDTASGNDTIAPKEGEAAADAVPEGEYTLTAPEGTEGLDPTVVIEATPLLKELGLGNVAAQKLADHLATKVVPHYVTAALAAHQTTLLENAAQVQADWAKAAPAALGANLAAQTEALTHVARARDTYFDADTRNFLTESGMGNHPGLLKALAAIGKELGDGKVHMGDGGGEVKLTPEQIMYGDAYKRQPT